MKDMQDVFRAMLTAIGRSYPHVDLMENIVPRSTVFIPLRDQAKLDLVHVVKILNEAVDGEITIASHENDWWEFHYNNINARNIPVQFLKIFEIYYGIPSQRAGYFARFFAWIKGFFR